MTIPKLVIAGTNSGVGKTTISVGIMAALRRRGLAVQPFKVGPDYIDPSHHTVATGRVSRNLDSWMVPKPALLELFDRACRGADVAVVEGVMGLFDGHSGSDETGSTAEIAKLLDAPVLVVIDASRMARSAAAIAWGFSRFDPALKVAGFITNRIASEKHFRMVREAIESSGAGRLFGYLPKDASLHLSERHLGLIPTDEQHQPGGFLDTLVALIESHVDLDRLLEAVRHQPSAISFQPDPLGSGRAGAYPPPPGDGRDARAPGGDPHSSLITHHSSLFPHSLSPSLPHSPSLPLSLSPTPPLPPSPPPVIAVARDEAFNFYYQDNLDLLEAHGAELVFFSPMRDGGIPEAAGALYLGGGFPEEHAAVLAGNRPMLEAIRRAVADGMPVYGECGGLMYLCEGIVTTKDERCPMVGVVPGWCTMQGKRLKLGYVEVRALMPTPLGEAGYVARGHEFHYSTWDGASTPDSARAITDQGDRQEGVAKSKSPYEFHEGVVSSASSHELSDREGLAVSGSANNLLNHEGLAVFGSAYEILNKGGRREGYAKGNLLASFAHLHFATNPALAPAFVAAARQGRRGSEWVSR